ncbi:hypothetical protein [Paraclostridium sordellii]|uniref:hypothetical protein n=1 Tax=Paraclostridium sordellii TaxID=1505 RepID=UPI0005DBDF8E|nr:hypothetical protein [Paeniclostridium sordellii]CEN21242.1 putative transcriptional regulator [[Clostridium] sordellii] [Paeniclostridium sordellii]
MNKTKKLKDIILSQYSSIREFSKAVEIPSTTLTSALDKDIGGMAVDRVIKICDALSIDVKTFEPISKNDPVSISQKKLVEKFNVLNKVGKQEAIKRVEELTHINKYIDDLSLQDETKVSYLDPIAAHDDNLTRTEKELMNQIIQNKIKIK